jgi:hypothetical protein
MRKLLPLGVAVGLLGGGFACSGGDDDPVTDTGEPPAFTVSLTQARWDYGTPEVGVRVTNTGDTSFTVENVQLVWPGLPESPETPKDTEFPPGHTIDLVTTLGAPDCTGYPTPEFERPTARLQIIGIEQPVTATLDDHGVDWLQRLYDGACEEEALRAVADVRLSDDWTRIEVDDIPYLRGWIELARNSGDEPVTVTSMLGSVLLSFEPIRSGQPVGTLDGGEQLQRIPVRIGSASRCDGHALGGSTQTFVFNVYVRRGTAPEQEVILVPDQDTQREALAVVRDTCA